MCLGIPARIVYIQEPDGLSRPAMSRRSDGTEMKLDLAMVPDAVPGDYVIAHSGFALSLLTEEEAREAIDLLNYFEGGDIPTTATYE